MERDYQALCLDYLRELIAISTVNLPGNETICARKIKALLEQEGFVCHLQEVAEGRSNLYTEVLEECDGKAPAIVLTGHMDTVPVADGWDSDPFTLTEKQLQTEQNTAVQNTAEQNTAEQNTAKQCTAAFFGRGTCDMKGGIAAMMAAAVWAKDQGKIAPFRLAFVADEEIYGTGSQMLAKSGVLGDVKVAVIGEPTLNQIHVAHRGALRYHVTVIGKSGHAGKPHLFVDPIHAAARVTLAVEEVCKDLTKRDQSVLPPATMCMTEIHSSLKDNVIPEICTMTIDTRPCIGDSAEHFEQLIRQKIREMGGIQDGAELVFDPYIDVKAGYLDPDSEAVRTCQRAYERAFQEKPVVDSFPACCDQTYFTSLGIPALLYGPGSIDQAHTTNEYVTKDELMKALRFYQALLSE